MDLCCYQPLNDFTTSETSLSVPPLRQRISFAALTVTVAFPPRHRPFHSSTDILFERAIACILPFSILIISPVKADEEDEDTTLQICGVSG